MWKLIMAHPVETPRDSKIFKLAKNRFFDYFHTWYFGHVFVIFHQKTTHIVLISSENLLGGGFHVCAYAQAFIWECDTVIRTYSEKRDFWSKIGPPKYVFAHNSTYKRDIVLKLFLACFWVILNIFHRFSKNLEKKVFSWYVWGQDARDPQKPTLKTHFSKLKMRFSESA